MKRKTKLVNQRNTTHVRIDKGLHKLLKVKAAMSGRTIRELLEEVLGELLAVTSET